MKSDLVKCSSLFISVQKPSPHGFVIGLEKTVLYVLQTEWKTLFVLLLFLFPSNQFLSQIIGKEMTWKLKIFTTSEIYHIWPFHSQSCNFSVLARLLLRLVLEYSTSVWAKGYNFVILEDLVHYESRSPGVTTKAFYMFIFSMMISES